MSNDPRTQLLTFDVMLVDASDPADIAADGFTALHRAAMRGDLAVVHRLLAFGTPVDQRSDHPGVCDGVTALHCAVAGGHVAVVDRLIRSGASVEARDGAGYTPLGLAAELGHYDVVKRLLAAGARACAEVGDATPLSFARRGGHGVLVALFKQVCGARSR